MIKSPTHLLKKTLGLCGLLVLIQSAQAQFTFPVYEPFSEYPEGERLRTAGSSGVFWNLGNSVSSTSSPIISTNYALSYPGLLPDPNTPARGILGATAAGRSHGATFTAQTTGTNYASFLLDVQSLPTADRPIFGINGANSGTPNPSSGDSVWITALGQLKIGKNSQTTPLTNTTAPLTIGSTYLVVVGYKFANSEVDLWVNPTVLGNNANIPAPTIFSTNGSPSTTLQSVNLYSGTGIALSTNLFDEIRVASSWAGVTPSSPAPGNVYDVTGGGSGCPGDSFAVGLSGSDSSAVEYLLYTNGTYSGKMATGTGAAFSFGPQAVSGTYTVLATNTSTADVGWMSGSVNVSLFAGPVITTEPIPVLVATNGVATFSVVATGDNLIYQWYRNGVALVNGGNILGATTPQLTISPATTADSAPTATGYYVLITNSCELFAFSTTNALTLEPAGNLVWQGVSPNTNWDLATSASWTNAVGAATVFHAGDNVTFNDSSANPLVFLVGTLTPSLVTESAGESYAFTGSGSIAGTGSLLMNGSGVLSISNANSFTGGSTISSGKVADDDANQQALGIGVITLAGGTLEMGLKSGVATVGLSNINVTASSALQFDGAGSLALNILGPVTGSPAATLTVFSSLNANLAPDRVRLYSIFTNNSPIVISTTGDEVEIAPYNTNGAQVFNGVISGSGGRIVPRSTGIVTFNAANTFNDNNVQAGGNGPSGFSVLLSGGNVGLGIDSVSVVNPPAVDSGPVGTGILGISVGEGGNDSLFASGGAHTVGNAIAYTSTTNSYTLLFNGSNNLTLSGTFALSTGSDAFGTNRTWQVNNTACTTLAGAITDAGLGSGVTKTGNGFLYLNGANTYTGPTAVNAGLLAGTGTIVGPVLVQTNGSIGGGSGTAIGTLTISSNLTLNGNVFVRVNKSLYPAQSNDVVSVSGTLANIGTGTVTVTNSGGGSLAVGDRFQIFSQAVSGGSTLAVTGGGMNWTNRLAFDGSITALSIANTVNPNPTNIVFTVSGSTLNLSWPTDHTGWVLQSQTNSLAVGLSTNWVSVPGSESANTAAVTVSPGNGAVFYRLVLPAP